ncbi:MAG TPA: ABC transporter permease [Solirubrobacteraceae bacterium]|nr:ABC transporter permease [Solirubrobacteraceae bacterium]
MSSPTISRPHRREDEFTGERHVYVPHSVGLPPLGSYARELWRRREFAVELAKTKLREQNFDTVFGQLWLVLNPMLLALVYFILVDILRASDSRNSEFFAHLVAGLFAFMFIHNAMTVGVRSVTKGGRLILNSAFPRALLPLSAVITAFMRFLPTMIVYVPVHIASGLPVNWNLLWAFPVFALMILLACGLSMLVAAGQVYFRDLSNFLPYALRIWLYISPVLYYTDEVPDRYKWLLDVNPMGGLLTAWSDVINAGHAPQAESMLLGLAWGVGLFIVAGLFFLSREREFAVRL